jgi:hypothetical protein
MIAILNNIDMNNPPNAIACGETCVASSASVVVYTGNYYAGYSRDDGYNFTALDPWGLCLQYGQNFCCDQVVIYIPQLDLFMWLIQTNEGNYVCALASPDQITSTFGRVWHTLLLKATDLGGSTTDVLDFPELAVGKNFLYMTTTLVGKYTIAIRIPLTDLSAVVKLRVSTASLEFLPLSGIDGLRPAQYPPVLDGIDNHGLTGYFVGRQQNMSGLLVLSWPETDPDGYAGVVTIPTTPTDDWEVTLPDGHYPNWLSTNPSFPSKINTGITGLTRQYQKLWVAWTGARKVLGDDPTNNMPYPHIGLAIIDINTFECEYHLIYNDEWAYAYPALATNSYGDVGMSFCYGGNKLYVQSGIAVLSDLNGNFSHGEFRKFTTVTSGNSVGGGSHYQSIRQQFPMEYCFSASVHNEVKDPQGKVTYHPHYVSFL